MILEPKKKKSVTVSIVSPYNCPELMGLDARILVFWMLSFKTAPTGVISSLSLLQGNLPNPGIEPRSPAMQEDSLPAEPQGKPPNSGQSIPSGVGSLFLLQRIFLTQESNRRLLHCRWILYQLSYRGSPKDMQQYINKMKSNIHQQIWGST